MTTASADRLKVAVVPQGEVSVCQRMPRFGLFYLRFMDDILVLAPTRWRLRKAVTEALGSLCLLKHPNKSFIGSIERGLDFMGYHFSPDGLSVAKKTVENFIARAARLYEQEPEEACASTRLGLYVRRWVGWACCGIYPPDRAEPAELVPDLAFRSSWTRRMSLQSVPTNRPRAKLFMTLAF